MPFMTNRRKIFLDSSILVEKIKGTKEHLFDILMADDSLEKCFSETVLSEVTFHLLAELGKKAPRTLKENKSIGALLQDSQPENLFGAFTLLPSHAEIVPTYLRLMQTFNLLPNDALILATCLLHGVEQVASYDPDFEQVCAQNALQLIAQAQDLSPQID
jgi:uncharacterized protein